MEKTKMNNNDQEVKFMGWNIMDFIEEEEKKFMQKQVGKSLTDLSEELGVQLEGEKLRGFFFLESKLEEQFLFRLFENENFLDFEVLGHFKQKYTGEDFFALYLDEEDEPCPCCGTVRCRWYGLYLHENRPGLCYAWFYDIDSLYDSMYVGQRLRKVKPLIENMAASGLYRKE